MAEYREIEEINGGGYRVRIHVSEGANCICLENPSIGADILRQPDASVGIDNPYLYGMPILFPVNRIAGGRFCFEGRDYRFPINEPETGCHLHGELHKKPFVVLQKTASHIVCSYSSVDTDRGFPHPYTVTLHYAVSENGLSLKTEVTNHSASHMPALLGFHTTFNVPFLKDSDAKNIRVAAEVSDEVERDPKTYLPTGRIRHDSAVSRLFNSGEFSPLDTKISLHYRARGAGAIVLTDTVRHMQVVYENDAKFGWRLFYNGNADQFICLEPQTCMVNCKNSGLPDSYTGFDSVPPFSTKAYRSSIRLQAE